MEKGTSTSSTNLSVMYNFRSVKMISENTRKVSHELVVFKTIQFSSIDDLLKLTVNYN